jgi:DNA-binding MarR family transcriptional regulator
MNLGLGAVRVTELAERACVTQQAMGKMLKELERIGYIARDIDGNDKRAKRIRLTDRGVDLINDMTDAVADTRTHYAAKVGEQELDELELRLTEAIRRIDLDYLPESWLGPSRAA